MAVDANVLISIATPAQAVLRPYPLPGPDWDRLWPAPQGIAAWYKSFHQIPPDRQLFLQGTRNSPLWGDAIGSLQAARLLASAGAGAGAGLGAGAGAGIAAGTALGAAGWTRALSPPREAKRLRARPA